MKDINLPLDQPNNAVFKDLVLKILRAWPWFILSVVITMFAAVVYLRYAVPEYNISASILIKDDKNGGGNLGSSASVIDMDIFKSSESINNEMEVLKSKRLMQRVLSDLNMQTSVYSVGTIKTTELYGKINPLHILLTSVDSLASNKILSFTVIDKSVFELKDEKGAAVRYNFGQKIALPYAVFTVMPTPALQVGKAYNIKFNDIRDLSFYYNRIIAIEPVNKDASVLSLNLIDAIPQKGLDILNKLVEDYNQEAIEDKNLLAKNTVKFIDDRLSYILAELTGVEKNVETYKKKNDIIDIPTNAGVYIQQSSDYTNKANDIEIQINILSSIESYLRKPDNKFSLVPSTLGIEDKTLTGLIESFNGLQSERTRLLLNVQNNSPLISRLDNQLETLRTNIMENLKNIKQGLVMTRGDLNKKIGSFNSRMNTVPTLERGLTDIKRQQVIKETLYGYLLQKREEASISLASAVSSFRIVDPAYVEKTPVKPKRLIIYLIAFIAGLAFPVASIALREQFNTKIQSVDDVTNVIAVPILGEITHNDVNETLVISHNARSAIAERFRLVRSNLHFTNPGKENKVIMVTSSRSGEGKTFFSINLASSLVLTGKRVVLLEFDIRKPKILADLGLAAQGKGISNFLVDPQIKIEDIIFSEKLLSGLYIIPAGPIPPNPAELLLTARLEEMIATLRDMFDYIIIDTSPIGQVADAFTLSKFIDTCIYVVRYGYTFKENLSIVKDIYDNKKINNLSIVMNDASKEQARGYGYGYGYGGYGVEEEKDKKGMARFFKFLKKQ
ncbi:GumC family protein [Mucilaginibacter polytrichastri]|uniref:non-specific protein-tyrosine kinase n=1 Tax=Mucilaginibacter polytrichastri TaxID=1302689 RepID=A0A1Q6A3A0_9SPHI|nr:tyrosine-protein kinase [Mucilaginibacter polytrichastri]OKS88471.1 hypothetical protein RG47T_3938 [Mucilaginibacter polytrichastri]SFT12278.1 capsular exopolysaccharide family [Mucilaginibacter polytrichastri]